MNFVIKKVSAAFVVAVLSLAALLLFASPARASENVIDSIDIAVTIHGDGSASVTDERQFVFNDATEHYIPFASLGESEIQDVQVTQDGQELSESSPWDVDRSLDEKAGQFGVVETSDGLEIAWGIGSTGPHEAAVSYRITNFVRQLSDGNQAVYWQFLHDGMTETRHVSIDVSNDSGVDYTAVDTQLHGYGFEGTSQVTPTSLRMETDSYSSDSRAVMLAIFPPNTFDTSASWPWNAEEIKAQADEGTDSAPSTAAIAALFAGFAALIAAIFAGLRSYLKKRPATVNGFAPSSRKVEHTTMMPQGELMGLSSLYRHLDEQLLVAYLMKWILDRNLIEQDYEHGRIFKDTRTGLRIAQQPTCENQLEFELWELVTAAAGDDDFIEQSEINNHFTKVKKEFNEWVKRVQNYSQDYLLKQGLVTKVRKEGMFPRDEFELTERGQQVVDQMEGFKKYLRDGWYPEAAPNPKEHLMWAGLLGALQETNKRLGESNAYYPAIYAATSMSQQAATGFAPASTATAGGMGAAGAASGGGAR